MSATPLSWINKRQPKADWPDWLAAHAIGRPEANGSFMIRTKLGQVRVHVGLIVFEWKGYAHVCAPSEVKARVAELVAADAPPPAPDKRTSRAPRLLEAEVADRSDDTDDITRKLRGVPDVVTIPTKPRTVAATVSAAPAKLSRWPKPKGMPPSIENRHPDELKVDDSYQRSIDTGPSRALIKRIAAGWDWRKCLPLVVSKRDDGSLFVIDGQHRLAAAQLRGDIQFLPCCVAIYAGVADEAAMFVEMNRERRAINRLDDFHAARAGADPDATAIAELIQSAGFTVSRRTGSATWVPGEVAFTSAITKVRRKNGDAVVREALAMMAEAFAGQRLSAGSSVFTATCAVLVAPPPNFDRARLRAALATFDMVGWSSFLSESKGGSDRHSALRDMLLAAYADVPPAHTGEAAA